MSLSTLSFIVLVALVFSLKPNILNKQGLPSFETPMNQQKAQAMKSKIARVSAAPSWTSCGTPSDILTIQSVTFSPSTPVAGQEFSLVFKGSLSKQVTSGNADVEVKYWGVDVFHKTVSICTDPKLPCPFPAGAFDHSESVTIPGAAPHGHYTGSVKITDQTGAEVTCINFSFDLS